MFEFLEDHMLGLILGFIAALIMAVVYSAYCESQDPHIMLNKTEWSCSHSHTIYVPITTGKTTIIMPEDICDTYRMNGY